MAQAAFFHSPTNSNIVNEIDSSLYSKVMLNCSYMFEFDHWSLTRKPWKCRWLFNWKTNDWELCKSIKINQMFGQLSVLVIYLCFQTFPSQWLQFRFPPTMSHRKQTNFCNGFAWQIFSLQPLSKNPDSPKGPKIAKTIE